MINEYPDCSNTVTQSSDNQLQNQNATVTNQGQIQNQSQNNNLLFTNTSTTQCSQFHSVNMTANSEMNQTQQTDGALETGTERGTSAIIQNNLPLVSTVANNLNSTNVTGNVSFLALTDNSNLNTSQILQEQPNNNVVRVDVDLDRLNLAASDSPVVKAMLEKHGLQHTVNQPVSCHESVRKAVEGLLYSEVNLDSTTNFKMDTNGSTNLNQNQNDTTALRLELDALRTDHQILQDMLATMQEEREILTQERSQIEAARLREKEEVRDFHEAAQRYLAEREAAQNLNNQAQNLQNIDAANTTSNTQQSSS